MGNLCFNCYPPEAFAFVSESLARAVEDVHGPTTQTHETLHKLMLLNGIGPAELSQHYLAGNLDPAVSEMIAHIGGPDALDRHISGTDLCHTLKTIALERWGLLARVVLHSWNITRTLDFGHIVMEMVEKGHMSKKTGDTLEDFREVYSFAAAFDDVKLDDI